MDVTNHHSSSNIDVQYSTACTNQIQSRPLQYLSEVMPQTVSVVTLTTQLIFESCALLSINAACSDNSLPTFRGLRRLDPIS